MKQFIFGLLLGLVPSILISYPQDPEAVKEKQTENQAAEPKPIRLGNFSVSLAVKDIQTSIAFYQQLGFRQVGGDPKQRWIVMQNETAKIGLFQGMLEKNTLTFNPGWDSAKKELEDFDDVRDLQTELISRGIAVTVKAAAKTDGPAYMVLNDPDGNPILIDQHVARKKQ